MSPGDNEVELKLTVSGSPEKDVEKLKQRAQAAANKTPVSLNATQAANASNAAQVQRARSAPNAAQQQTAEDKQRAAAAKQLWQMQAKLESDVARKQANEQRAQQKAQQKEEARQLAEQKSQRHDSHVDVWKAQQKEEAAAAKQRAKEDVAWTRSLPSTKEVERQQARDLKEAKKQQDREVLPAHKAKIAQQDAERKGKILGTRAELKAEDKAKNDEAKAAAQAAKGLGDAGRNLTGFNKALRMFGVGPNSHAGRILSGLTSGGVLGGIAAAGAVAAYTVNAGWDYYQKTAAVANPNLAATAEQAQKLYEIKSGAGRGGYLEYQASLYTEATGQPGNTKWNVALAADAIAGNAFMKSSYWARSAMESSGLTGAMGWETLEEYKAKNKPLPSGEFFPKGHYAGVEEYGDILAEKGNQLGQAEQENLAEQLKNMAGVMQSNSAALDALRLAIPSTGWHGD